MGCCTPWHIEEVIYPTWGGEAAFKDADFSKAAIEELWRLGYRDACRLLERRPWEDPVSPHTGVVVHTADAPADSEARDLVFRQTGGLSPAPAGMTHDDSTGGREQEGP